MHKPRKNPHPVSSFDPPATKLDEPVAIEAPEYMTNNSIYKTKAEAEKS